MCASLRVTTGGSTRCLDIFPNSSTCRVAAGTHARPGVFRARPTRTRTLARMRTAQGLRASSGPTEAYESDLGEDGDDDRKHAPHGLCLVSCPSSQRERAVRRVEPAWSPGCMGRAARSPAAHDAGRAHVHMVR